jgi:hypothetical protein
MKMNILPSYACLKYSHCQQIPVLYSRCSYEIIGTIEVVHTRLLCVIRPRRIRITVRIHNIGYRTFQPVYTYLVLVGFKLAFLRNIA